MIKPFALAPGGRQPQHRGRGASRQAASEAAGIMHIKAWDQTPRYKPSQKTSPPATKPRATTSQGGRCCNAVVSRSPQIASPVGGVCPATAADCSHCRHLCRAVASHRLRLPGSRPVRLGRGPAQIGLPVQAQRVLAESVARCREAKRSPGSRVRWRRSVPLNGILPVCGRRQAVIIRCLTNQVAATVTRRDR
jgi:hypothetical protein